LPGNEIEPVLKIGGILKSNSNFNLRELKQRLKGKCLSGGDLLIAIGLFFLGMPYRVGTLESPGREKLILNFHQFDCTTFVETILALARCAASEKIFPSEFRRTLQLIRYHGGVIDGYSSRLHYFTDWLRDNEKKKIIKDVSGHVGGQPQRKKINYMTAHHSSYPALKNDNELQKMLLVEKNLSRRVFHIIRKDRVNEQKTKIQNGDVIAFVTTQEGLDVAHVGFAIWRGRHLHLLHASSSEGRVIVSQKTLVVCLKQNKKYLGIIVARPTT
jgi:hypothetical protein